MTLDELVKQSGVEPRELVILLIGAMDSNSENWAGVKKMEDDGEGMDFPTSKKYEAFGAFLHGLCELVDPAYIDCRAAPARIDPAPGSNVIPPRGPRCDCRPPLGSSGGPRFTL